MSYLFLAVEDELSEAVGRKIIADCLGNDVAVTALRKNGFGYLKSKIQSFAAMAERSLVVLLTDLDSGECAPALIRRWYAHPVPAKLIFRVAVREVESWLLADRSGFAAFLGVEEHSITTNVEALVDPKAELIRLAGRGRREIRAELVPPRGAKAMQGLGYNAVLTRFVETEWDRVKACENSDSLDRACRRLIGAQRYLEN